MLRKLSFSLLLFFFPLSVWAAALPSPTGHINDFASILTTEQKATLETGLVDYETKTSNEIAVLIIKSLDGQNIDDFGIKAFEEWKIGKKGKDNGVLLTIAIDDRKMRIDVGYGLEGQLTDSKSGDIIRNIISPEFKKGDYYSGITSGLLAIQEAIAGTYSSSPQTSSDVIFWIIMLWVGGSFLIYFCSFLARSKSFWAGGVIGVIIGIIASSVIAAVILGLLGLLLDWLLSKNYQKLKASGKKTTWWDSGGGFFTGGGSSSGGGFCGGSSGGGGSSGSW
ncbi:MAG: Beta-propeller domain-containing protein, methanol dehydrogenase [Candidatus Woesebacteria bacterium GW2011_GWA1_41_13b]|uniref:Beta-propeller domain-containing protein, methanol dehydrogenase n=1 Tax=Candidatus Woesebacteria bacterium GW2011_GWA1_41_13b TaxID=1618555 RepID=A0A0G0UTB5_9BACT|nr:MAG: Beta-propeller domain-containing protein, methanol dehydrogenase [Candidatus Woesebacteria bacterium GW2011_GWA1_41_13b]